MSLRILSDGCRDIVRPSCGHPHGYEWDNEYSDPEVGLHEVECRSCGHEFQVEVTIDLTKEIRQELERRQNETLNDTKTRENILP